VTFSATKALRISRPAWLPRSDHLCPFALYGAFLHALVRHDPHDYYGHSVSVEVALRRRIPCSVTMRRVERNVGASHITFLRPHWSPSFLRGYPGRLLYPRYRKALAQKRSARGRVLPASVSEVRAILPSPSGAERGSASSYNALAFCPLSWHAVVPSSFRNWVSQCS
jgi:hypothetical protein